MPDSIKSCGELITPPETITSRSALTVISGPPPSEEYSTPNALLPSNTTLWTSFLVSTVKFGRFMAGRRYATAALQRLPQPLSSKFRAVRYWTTPLLQNGKKADIRIYGVITSFKPLRVLSKFFDVFFV